MTRKRAFAVALGGFTAVSIVGILGWLSRGATAPSVEKPQVTEIAQSDPIYASQLPVPRPHVDATIPLASAVPRSAPVERAVETTVEATEKPGKPTPKGFAQGRLPTAPNLRSAPSVQASPRLQEIYQARASRAAMLDRRLERYLAELRTKAQRANASERSALEHDIAILEAQLAARRPLESPDKPTR